MGYNLFQKRASVRSDDDSTDFAATVASLPPGYDVAPAAGPESVPLRRGFAVDSQPAGPDSGLDAGLMDSQPAPMDLALEQSPTIAHIGRYALKGLLGAGGLGQVHEAWDPLLSRTVAQQAALACFEPESIAEYERRRADMKARRDLVVPALQAMGLPVPVQPDGAFYAWFDCSAHAASSWDFCRDMMQRAHVALTPGRDFGPAWAEQFVCLSFASSVPQLQAALARLKRELGSATPATGR